MDMNARIAITAVILLTAVMTVDAQRPDPTDWSDWETYRNVDNHPCTNIKPEDLERARANIERFEWAQEYRDRVVAGADGILEQLSPEFLAQFIPRTTPGGRGPCPSCRQKGLPWHPNGQFSWSPSNPEVVTCRVCDVEFPNDEYPETVEVHSTWGEGQTISFYGGDTFKTFGYLYERPSFSGMVRRAKVGYMIGKVWTMAYAYALTEDPKYARGTRDILLRFAEVIPGYLVRAGYGYGEYAGMDPHVAAKHINDLPEDELVYPPNEPDRKIYTGYWSASRLGTSGMDGGRVSQLTVAYDLTCLAEQDGEPVYSHDQRILIERDVLLESSYLLACDNSINNKSVGNRTGAALVGLCVGHPGLVHFGVEGFKRTVNDWFLPDGGTSESPAYAMMTMGGIRRFPLAFRDYSDPPGYTTPGGERLDGFNASRDTLYGDCWQSLIWTMQGNLRHTPDADSYRTTRVSGLYAELIALAYPTPQHIALLKELAGGEETPPDLRTATLYRDPALADVQAPPFELPDVVFPYLSQGYLRTGEHGRDSTVMLNASHWGGHHHYDSLDLYYWKDGRELLSDLGYLWDHPDSYQTKRTWAHNLVMVNEQGQRHRGRGGSFHLFATLPGVKAMEASSTAYDRADLYRRTCVQVEHPEGSYLADIFRVRGGSVHEYVFHGPHNDYEVEGLDFAATQLAQKQDVRFALRFHLSKVGEVCVDDVEIRPIDAQGNEGENIVPNPTAEVAEGRETPAGWGHYSGNGRAEWGAGEPGRDDATCARMEATQPDEDGRVNQALICGDSNGYRGPNALMGERGQAYRVRFAIRGTGGSVNVGTVAWPNDPTSTDDRMHATVDMDEAVIRGDDWRVYEGTFVLDPVDQRLDNTRSAAVDRPWALRWTWEDGYAMNALFPAAPDETALIGDGWGQRDHRNSDRGATLPYVIRRRVGAGYDDFVAVFEGVPGEAEAVARGVTRLPLPDDAPETAVALMVETAGGADIIVSMLEPAPLTVDTPAGPLTTDARLAVVTLQESAPVSARMVEGTTLQVGASALSLDAPALEGEVTGSDSGEGDAWFEVAALLPGDIGLTLHVTDDEHVRAYPIRGLEPVEGGTRILTKLGSTGFVARTGGSWRIPLVATWTD
ncbi:MAG: hypothetical protein GF393_09840 [Armatimonadia bacterium]|nr:hypothetical protein [Armatimonadia bacterium]